MSGFVIIQVSMQIWGKSKDVGMEVLGYLLTVECVENRNTQTSTHVGLLTRCVGPKM